MAMQRQAGPQRVRIIQPFWLCCMLHYSNQSTLYRCCKWYTLDYPTPNIQPYASLCALCWMYHTSDCLQCLLHCAECEILHIASLCILHYIFNTFLLGVMYPKYYIQVHTLCPSIEVSSFITRTTEFHPIPWIGTCLASMFLIGKAMQY